MPATALPACSSATLRSFGVIICVGVFVIVAFVSYLTGSILWLVVGFLSTLALAAIGISRPQNLLFPYRAWNRLARGCAKVARLWVLTICFYVLLVAVGRTGSALRLQRPVASASLWIKRKTLSPEAYHSQHATPRSGSPARGWIAAYLSWTVQTRNYWASCLLPFFILLSALEPEHESNVSTDLYTLF
jgi:hypothetical protein